MAKRAAARERLVVVGDLNGAHDALVAILKGTGLVDARLRWIGGASELVQIGDLFNRGGGARRALQLLLRLQREAKKTGGRVSILLGNHEVMTALGNEAYCTEGEYLAFASARERKAWPARVQRAAQRLYRAPSRGGRILPFEPRLDAWKALHAPGQAALRRELGPRGKLGRALRQLPMVRLTHGLVCVHAGILPAWAAHGVDGLNQIAIDEWQNAGKRYRDIGRGSLFRNPEGPLWDRTLARAGGKAKRDLARSLALLGAERMVVGHTPTHTLPGGEKGRVFTRFDGRLVLVDVGLGEGEEAPRAALLVEDGKGFEWTPAGLRRLWGAKGERRRALKQA
ncbi:MAG: metallophosphoesterase [Polyangiaceae bacterium]